MKINWQKLKSQKWYKDACAKSLFIHIYIHTEQGKLNTYQTTIKQLAEELDLSVGQVRGSLKKLIKSSYLTSTSTNKYSALSLTKTGLVEDFVLQANKQTNKQDFYDISINDVLWLEQIAKMFQSKTEKVKRKLTDFNAYLLAVGDRKKTMQEYRQHFLNWLKNNSADIKDIKLYQWKWKGQSTKEGSYEDMIKDKKRFDQPGFDFKLCAYGN
jgi:hypothetical protein